MRVQLQQAALKSALPRLTVEPSLSGENWCIAVDGDRAHPIYQHDRKWRVEAELERLTASRALQQTMKAATLDAKNHERS